MRRLGQVEHDRVAGHVLAEHDRNRGVPLLPCFGLHHGAHENRFSLCVRHFDADHRAPRNRRQHADGFGRQVHRNVVGDRLDLFHVDSLVERDFIAGDARTRNIPRNFAGNLEAVERPLQNLAGTGDRLRRLPDRIGASAQHRQRRQHIFPAAGRRLFAPFDHFRADGRNAAFRRSRRACIRRSGGNVLFPVRPLGRRNGRCPERRFGFRLRFRRGNQVRLSRLDRFVILVRLPLFRFRRTGAGAQRAQRVAHAGEEAAGSGGGFRPVIVVFLLILFGRKGGPAAARNGFLRITFFAGTGHEHPVAQQSVPVGEIDDDRAAEHERPAENRRADRADQLAQHPFRQLRGLQAGGREHLSDSAAGQRKLRDAAAADAELFGHRNERIGRQRQQQDRAEQDHRLPGEKQQRPPLAGQDRAQKPQQRHQRQQIGRQPEQVEQPETEPCAGIADPVCGRRVHAPRNRGAVGRRIREDRQQRQQQKRNIKDVADPEA